MRDRPYKILLVEPDATMLEILVTSLSRRFDAHLTCVADAVSCLDVEMLDPHDLVIAELDLSGSCGLKLAEQLKGLSQRPVILLADDLSSDTAVEAMRAGVTDLYRKPFPIERLLDTVEEVLRDFDLQKRRAAKHRRTRELVRRVIRERRDLNQRVDLICRDLVEAQRRLVHRVLAIEERQAPQSR